MSFKEARIQAGMFKTPPFSLESPDYEPISGETIPRRNPQCVNGLKSIPEEGVHTLFDVLLRASEKFGDLDGVGTRKLIKTHHETKMVKKVVDGKEVSVEKKWTYFEMGKFEYHTFGEYVKIVLQIGAGFRKLGLAEGDRVHIFATTRYISSFVQK
jgi:long-chain acyl-CoA synthetase